MQAPHKRLAVAAAIMCVFGANTYAAQEQARQPGASSARSGAIDLTTWDQAQLKQGYSAQKLMDMKAKGQRGEDIGDVNDILVDTSGKVAALIISHGGIFGIGDKELRVPFNEVKVGPKLESLLVPIVKDNVDRYRIKGDRQAQTGEMKVSELLNDQVTLRGGVAYGNVRDMILSRDGQVKAIVVDDVERRDRYAMPWRDEAYDRRQNRFGYDYERNQVNQLRPFNYSALQIAEPERRTTTTAGQPAGQQQRAAAETREPARGTTAGQPAQQQARGGTTDITTWDHAELRSGFSAEKLMDLKAKGNKGEDIGDVKDILVDRNGKVTSLIVSHGGVFGIGDKELRVPFNQVKLDPKLENLVVPIAKENVENFRIKEDRQAKAGGEMKVSEMLNDQVALRGGAKYGDVKDLIISRDGQVKAIVIDPDDAKLRGRYAMPWRGDVYDPAANRFTYDYERNQIEKLRPFDYAAVGVAAPGRRTAAGAKEPAAGRTGGTEGRSGEGASGSGSTSR